MGLVTWHKDGATMIMLTRHSGSVFALNSELIERIDSTPDTVITLVDGKKYVVAEPLEQVVDAVRFYRGQTIALGSHLAAELEAQPETRPAPLASVAHLPGTEPRHGEG
jgi:flagellar protein FlbD